MSITLSNRKLSASIDPKGAELFSLKSDKDKEYVWEGNPAYWGKHSPVLFPIVGTLRNDTYTYNGKSYSMTRHGFARDRIFSIKEQDESSATFLLSSDEETLKAYPFGFQLEICYTLEGASLYIQYTVTNNSGAIMPFSIGAHPAFALPGKFEEYSLEFEKNEPLVSYRLNNDLLSEKTTALDHQGNRLPLNYTLFAQDALIFKHLESGYVDIMKNMQPLLRVSFEGFPYLGIWTKPGAPFLCIEPWHGHSDIVAGNGNILEKEGIIKLQPGASFATSFGIEVF